MLYTNQHVTYDYLNKAITQPNYLFNHLQTEHLAIAQSSLEGCYYQ